MHKQLGDSGAYERTDTRRIPSKNLDVLADYWKTYRHQGLRSVWANLVERYWFDWRFGTDTGLPLARPDFQQHPMHFEHGLSYASSWTSEVKLIFQQIRILLGDSFPDWTFVDIGCGKGKVVLQWQQECRRAGVQQQAIGVDYYEPLIQIAQSNHRKLFSDSGRFVVGEASAIDFKAFGDHVVAYLYNPFDAVVLSAVLQNLARQPCVLIYTNPTHAQLPERFGFRLHAHKRKSFHVNQETMIFISSHLRTDDPP